MRGGMWPGGQAYILNSRDSVKYAKRNWEQLKQLEPEVIAFAELEEFIDTPVKYYSTGMYLRLAFSLATSVQPEILVLDEMFAGGDAAFVKNQSFRAVQILRIALIMNAATESQNFLHRRQNREH